MDTGHEITMDKEMNLTLNKTMNAMHLSQASPSLLSNSNEVTNTRCTISTDAEKPKAMGILTFKAGKLKITRDPHSRAPDTELDHVVKDQGKREEDNQSDCYDYSADGYSSNATAMESGH